jgi:hypothetical protein
MANKEEFIPGIYNYCDRWCERCRFRNKCSLYDKEQKRLAEHESKGEDPYDWDIVLEDIKGEFEETLRLIHEAAEKQGIDLDDLPDEEYETPDPSDHPLVVVASGYSKEASAFLKTLRETIQAEGIDLSKRIEYMPTAKEDKERLMRIVSSYDTVMWYHTLIPVKIRRAIQSKMEIGSNDEFAEEDALTSAKIAYIGIMQSMASLRFIYDWDEELQDSALTLLAQIEQLRKGVDIEFPGHHKFKRPVFDD